ncbi:hypothetical protein [Streptomyces sp. A0958]|uniref:hypothetical protein n=1 Tax=Streptomyces sp. A0958 TaxID=2563101 RepID=UPI001F0D34D9|nr:hypothetical protein [Streptomyces sp. A0958]
MKPSKHDPYDEFVLVDQYDSFEDPWSRSGFLETIGRTRPYIDALRARRDAAREAKRATAEHASESSRRNGEPRRGRSRSPRRPRVVGTHPSNRTDIRYASRRRRPRTVVLVIVVIGLD